jgi:hydroxylysine kinase
MFDVPAVDRASPVSPAQAAEIALTHYGVSAAAERLASEHDDTFLLAGADGVRRLLKISAAPPALAVPAGGGAAGGSAAGGAPAGGAGFQTAVLLHLARVAPELPVQRVVATLDGRPEVTLDRPGREPRRVVRMTSWLDGQLLGRGTTSVELRREIGATLGRLNIALRGFAHPGAYRTHRWDLQNFVALRPLLEQLPESGMLPSVGQALAAGGLVAGGLVAGGLVAGGLVAGGLVAGGLVAGGLGSDGAAADGLRAALADCLDHFDAVVRPALAGVPVQVIHTDFHGENLLTGGGRITGILDFGDALAGPVAMDVGVAACYQLGARGPDANPLAPALDADLLAPALEADLLAPALDVVAGYHAVDPLSDADLDLVAEFIVARVAARIIVSQANATREPANSGYLLRRTPQAVAHLAALRAFPSDEIGRRLRAACHLEVVR